MKRSHRHANSVAVSRLQRGVAAVEFGLVSIVLFTLMFGAVEFGRMLYYWNATTEATRLGARIAVVCDLNDSDIKAKMSALFPVLATADINLNYDPAGCTVESCNSVTLTINPKNIEEFIPFNTLVFNLPPFTTTLTRESMQSTFGGVANPVCQ